MKKLKRIPKFESEKKEREFWQSVDATDYVDVNIPYQSFSLQQLVPDRLPVVVGLCPLMASRQSSAKRQFL